MPKFDPARSPLQGSTLRKSIVEKLGKLRLVNPDASNFGAKLEPVILVRHLMWAIRHSQKKDGLHGNTIHVASVAEVLQLTRIEAEEVVSFLQNTIRTSFTRNYS